MRTLTQATDKDSQPSESVAIGALQLVAPPRCKLLLASRNPERVGRFIASSPDRTVYHELPFITSGAGDNPGNDLLLLEEEGEPRFAVPVYVTGPQRLDTGYSGLALPAATAERTIRRGVASFFSLLEANGNLRYVRCTQAIVSAGGMDAERRAWIDFAWSASAPRQGDETLFTRVLFLPSASQAAGLPERSEVGLLEGNALDEDTLKLHEGDARNQIRQGARRGLTARYHLITGDDPASTEQAYADYFSISEASRTRTGLTPYPSRYWKALSGGIAKSGGHDLVVYALLEGRPVAAVVCHLYQRQALYWAGCSLPEGLQARGNPFCLHAAIALCRRMGVRMFELGRFDPQEPDEKERQVTQYKAQFGGAVLRMPSFRMKRRTVAGLLESVARRLNLDAMMGDRRQPG